MSPCGSSNLPGSDECFHCVQLIFFFFLNRLSRGTWLLFLELLIWLDEHKDIFEWQLKNIRNCCNLFCSFFVSWVLDALLFWTNSNNREMDCLVRSKRESDHIILQKDLYRDCKGIHLELLLCILIVIYSFVQRLLITAAFIGKWEFVGFS